MSTNAAFINLAQDTPSSPVIFLDRVGVGLSEALIQATWQAAVLAVVVWLICTAFKERIPAAWRCLLWLIVFARLALPWTPSSPVSIFNLIQRPVVQPASAASPHHFFGWVDQSQLINSLNTPSTNEITSIPTNTSQLNVGVSPSPAQNTNARVPAASTSSSFGLVGFSGILILSHWLIGVISVLAMLIHGHLKIRRISRASSLITDSRALLQVDAVRKQLGIAFPVPLTQSTAVQSPLILGVIRPIIIFPAGLIERLDPGELADVLLHELGHIKRHDILASWIIALILAAHWFNPFAWYAASRWRAEREFACDELALETIQPTSRKRYGLTLLKLVEQASRPWGFPAVAGIIENNADLHRRISMIATYRSHPLAARLSAACAVALVLSAGLTNAQPAKPKEVAPQAEAKKSPSPFRAGQSVVHLYTQAYKDSVSKDAQGRSVWTLPEGVTLQVMPEYRGSGEKGETYHDPRITIVAQDRVNRFWGMISCIENDSARVLRDELDQVVSDQQPVVKEGLTGDPAVAPVLAQPKPAKFVSSEALGQHGEIVISTPARLHVTSQSTVDVIQLALVSMTPGAQLKSDVIFELAPQQAKAFAAALSAELTKREAAASIAASPKPTGSGPMAGRDKITDHFLFPKSGIKANEFGVLELPPTSSFAVTASEKAAQVSDTRVVLSLKDPQGKVALVSRIPSSVAKQLASDIRTIVNDKKAQGLKPGNGENAIVVAPQVYTVDVSSGLVHVANVTFDVLPGYNGIGRNNERITDDRITLVINDSERSFWPLVARLDLGVADKLATDLEAVSK